MRIRELSIDNFRLFHGTKIILGKHITAITGFNATGKSTLLGLLGHCGEFRKYKPLLQSTFKVELGEILKFSEQYDKGIKDIGTITFEDVDVLDPKYPTKLSYRSTWQSYKDGKKRYRIIPKNTDEWPKSSKINWPTLYLGLSRLYPLGESNDVTRILPTGKLSEDEVDSIIRDMKFILTIKEETHGFSVASISETSKKRGFGLNTTNYNYLANSAGQDNLGQILLSILSFKRLKTQLGEDWHGGLLLIDELDATLHPLAQQKLLDYVYDQAKDIGIQIVFTTHSLCLLEYMCTKTDHNNPGEGNVYELISVTNANGPLVVEQNPSYDYIYKDLMATYNFPFMRVIDVFAEDNESRFFIERLLAPYAYRFKLLNVSFGVDELMRMLTSDPANFLQYLYIIDGDVGDEIIQQYVDKARPAKIQKCIVKLPGGERPEKVIWEYLINLPGHHPFFQRIGRHMGYSNRSITISGPDTDIYNGYEKERDKYKKWFADNKQLVEDVFPFWVRDKKETIQAFIESFIESFNWTAERLCIPKIRRLPDIEEVVDCQQAPLL